MKASRSKISFVLLTVFLTLFVGANAQEQETDKATNFKKGNWSGSVGGDLVSHYVWRGQDLAGVSFQPSLAIEWRGLSIGAWGDVSFDKDDTKEFDLTIGYSVKGFSVSITDYWFAYPGAQNHYFCYNKKETAHVWEAQVGYDWDFLALNWYTNFAGADGVNKNGKRAFSSYISLIAPWDWVKLHWEAELGMVPWSTDFYADVEHFSVVNVSLKAAKTINIKDIYSFDVYSQIIWNPAVNSAHFVFGLSL